MKTENVQSAFHDPFLLADSLRLMDSANTMPRDLPGRYGRAIRDLERLLVAADALAVVAGGWAVWRHGYAGRVTEDVDIVVAQRSIESLKKLAGPFGFEFLDPPAGRWPKMVHRKTQIDVDLLPETGFPGTATHPAPVAIAHPRNYQALVGALAFIPLTGLIELKLGAG